MNSFGDKLVEQITNEVADLVNPTVNEILIAIRNSCEAVDLENRKDIESYSVMAEFGDFDGQKLFLLSLNFELNLSETGEPIDLRRSIEFEFELDDPIPGKIDPVEYDSMFSLNNIFAAIGEWEPFLLVRDRSLPFSWHGPGV